MPTATLHVSHPQMEYMTLVNASGHVVANAGANDRRGEYFDPSGVVSRVLANPKYGQVGGRW